MNAALNWFPLVAPFVSSNHAYVYSAAYLAVNVRKLNHRQIPVNPSELIGEFPPQAFNIDVPVRKSPVLSSELMIAF